MQTFQFQLSNDFLKVPVDQPLFIEVDYSTVGDNKVTLLDIHIPPCLFPHIKDNTRLHDHIYMAAENNHANNVAVKNDHQHDIFKELGTYFQPKTLQP